MEIDLLDIVGSYQGSGCWLWALGFVWALQLLPLSIGLEHCALCLSFVGRPRVFAHRGGCALGPENTMAAFDLGLAAGADGLELDVRLSADGIVVVRHDETLDRTTQCDRPDGGSHRRRAVAGGCRLPLCRRHGALPFADLA